MEYIKAYFLNIISVIIFTVLVEILMPNNSLKGYIKLVLGLLVVLAVIKPITNLFDLNVVSFFDYEGMYVTSTRIDEVQNSQINSVFCDNLKTAIEQDISVTFNEAVDVKVDADVNEIRNVIIYEPSDERKSEIEKYILETYGVKKVTVGGE